MKKNSVARPRKVMLTVLLVGEGDAEEQFMKHLKSLYVQRDSGVSVTIKNARGKGAGHVVGFALRQSRNADYDVKAALLDTDTDWNDKTRSTARKEKLHVMPCHPCLEAVLLAIHRKPVEGRTTAQLKRDFESRFRAAASNKEILCHFGREVLDEARTRISILDQLLNVLTTAQLANST